jgi:hypothetical protein
MTRGERKLEGKERTATEPIRQIQDNELRLFNRSYGKADSDRGKDGGSLVLAFSNAAAVTTIQATVQVNDVGATGCPSTPEVTRAVILLGGSFFKSATPTPGNGLHDVWAIIGVVRGSDMHVATDILYAVSLVGHCMDADCKDSAWLHSKDLGPVKRGEMATLRVQWARDNHRFFAQRDDDPVRCPPGGSSTPTISRPGSGCGGSTRFPGRENPAMRPGTAIPGGMAAAPRGCRGPTMRN